MRRSNDASLSALLRHKEVPSFHSTAGIDPPSVEAVPDWDALAQPPPEYVFDQQVQW